MAENAEPSRLSCDKLISELLQHSDFCGVVLWERDHEFGKIKGDAAPLVLASPDMGEQDISTLLRAATKRTEG